MAATAPTPQFGAADGDHFDASGLECGIGIVVAVVADDNARPQRDDVVSIVPLLTLALIDIAAGWNDMKRL